MSETVENGTQAVTDAAVDADTSNASVTAEANQDTPETTDAKTDQSAKPDQPEDQQPEQPKRRPWFEKVISDKSFEAREWKRRAEAAEAALHTAKPVSPQPAPTAAVPTGYVPASEVRTEAARIVEAERFTDACNDIYNAGVSKHPDFDEAVKNFGMLGGTPQPFLEAVTALGKDVGAKVFYDLGKNPDEASRIMGLPPVKMAMEIAKLASAPPPAIPVSKVPPPITPITGNSVREGAEPDGKDIKAWAVWFNKQRSR